MTESEAQVIESAINFIQQIRHGLFKNNSKSKALLGNAVDELLSETDGDWAFNPDRDTEK